jgi:hypothetical protein
VPWPAREDDPRLIPSEENFYYHQEESNCQRLVHAIGLGSVANDCFGADDVPAPARATLLLLINKELGRESPMPTNYAYFNGTDDISDARLIADYAIGLGSVANDCFGADDVPAPARATLLLDQEVFLVNWREVLQRSSTIRAMASA